MKVMVAVYCVRCMHVFAQYVAEIPFDVAPVALAAKHGPCKCDWQRIPAEDIVDAFAVSVANLAFSPMVEI